MSDKAKLKPAYTSPRALVYQGDALEVLRRLPSNAAHCVVTSPPYWALRDYGVAGQLGLEKTPGEYIDSMVVIFAEVMRVLRPDGTCWVNIGDTHATFKGAAINSGGGEKSMGKHAKLKTAGVIPVNRASPNRMLARGTDGLKPKDLVGIPWLLAFALRSSGW